MTDAQGWTLLAMVGVRSASPAASSSTSSTSLRGYLDARFTGLEGALDARFDGVDRRLDHLDRDVQAVIRDRFDRD